MDKLHNHLPGRCKVMSSISGIEKKKEEEEGKDLPDKYK